MANVCFHAVHYPAHTVCERIFPFRAQLICQQHQHFSSRLRLAALRPRGVYGPGLLANALPHQTKSFCLHQPLPPLPLHDAHKYHQFTLVDLLQQTPQKGNDDRSQQVTGDTTASENILEGSNFFAALASGASSFSSEKASKTAAATIASFILSAAPAPAIAPHAFRRVPLQQPAKVHSAVSRASLPQQQLMLRQAQSKTGSTSTVGGSSLVLRAPGSISSTGSVVLRQQQQQWDQTDRWTDAVGSVGLGDTQDDGRRQKRRKVTR